MEIGGLHSIQRLSGSPLVLQILKANSFAFESLGAWSLLTRGSWQVVASLTRYLEPCCPGIEGGGLLEIALPPSEFLHLVLKTELKV